LRLPERAVKNRPKNQSDPEFREGLSEFWSHEGADQNGSLVVRTPLATPSVTAEVERVFSDGSAVLCLRYERGSDRLMPSDSLC
jgi:hypothetical protein